MSRKARALMVLGTASHVGKSVLVTGLCRIFHQDGLKVAPFKAQNMSLNSFATRDGREMSRAQAVQAQAAGIDPHADMNPILLKPSSDAHAQVVLCGRVFGNIAAMDYKNVKPRLEEAALAAYGRLAASYDYIILEGAGSPVEVNLRDYDIANLKMAEAADARCILVADIDRGGVFSQLVGTYELLEPYERSRFGGFIINKFRGQRALLDSGIEFLEKRLGWPCLGVIPHMPDLRIDQEDSVSLDQKAPPATSSAATLRICVVQLPHISNFTDFAPLEAMTGVLVFYAESPIDSRSADVILLPGSKNTISDLCWLKESGWADCIIERAGKKRPILGICGGFQMLGRAVYDPYGLEGELNSASGLGLLDAVTWLEPEKVTRQATATLIDPEAISAKKPGPVFQGYEIHMGQTRLGPNARPLFSLKRSGEDCPRADGAINEDGSVMGTYLHGLFDSDQARIALLAHWRRLCGKQTDAPSGARFNREDQYDRLAEQFRRHLDLKAIYRQIGIER